MKKVLALSVVAVLCVSLVALAGGEKKYGEKGMLDGKKMSGTISKVDTTEKLMVVKDKDGKEWSIYWNDSTKVEGGELKEGETVHCRATEKDGKMWATHIHVGEMKKM